MAVLALASTSCSERIAEALPSWSDGEARAAIVAFVASVTDPESPNFLPPVERVAVFDNHGTLLLEQPLVQMEFVYHRVRQLAAEHPEWADQEPFKAVLANDRSRLSAMSFRGRAELVAAAQSGISQAEFHAAVDEFLATAQHPRFGRSFTDLAYQPMLELVEYLHTNAFRVYVVSSGGIEFIRRFSEAVYGIPRERVIGSVMKYALRNVDGRPTVWRKPGFQGLNAGKFKVLNIDRHVGRRPILTVGNSDGDLEMLRYTDAAPHALAIVLAHDDAVREHAYTDEAERVIRAAREQGWLIVSMARDFRNLFPGDPE
jgi:hypothetical protein